MTYYHLQRAAVAACCALLLLGICAQAVAFNPQSEPPNGWRIEGFADLLATNMVVSNNDPPFGLSRLIVGDDVVDFSAAIVAVFDAPDNDGDGLPDDGTYPTDLRYFRVQIGDTSWDETIPNTGLVLEVQRGVIVGVAFTISDTLVEHPDLTFWLPASPGTWEALDERNGYNAGTVSGSYSLRDGVVPEPATVGLLGLGLVALAARRRRR